MIDVFLKVGGRLRDGVIGEIAVFTKKDGSPAQLFEEPEALIRHNTMRTSRRYR